MALSEQQRYALVEEAKTWIGTPYRNWSCLKGCGVDCGQLVYGVYRACGLLPEVPIPNDYTGHPGVHAERSVIEELFMPFFREIPESEVLPGDPVLFKTALRHAARTPGFAHVVMVVTWPNYVLHAVTHYGVSGEDAGRSPFFRRVERRFLTLR